MKTSPLYAPMQATLDAVFPGSYLLEAETGIAGVDFVLKQKIERTVRGATTISCRMIGITSGDWVQVKRNWDCTISHRWFGYAQLLESAISKLEKMDPTESQESILKTAKATVREGLKKRYPQRFTEMNDRENYLVMKEGGGVPDWKVMDDLAEALANRFHVDVGDVTLIVVADGEHIPFPAKQGLYEHDIRFYRADALGGALETFQYNKNIEGVSETSRDGVKIPLRELLSASAPIIGTETGTILKKSEFGVPRY